MYDIIPPNVRLVVTSFVLALKLADGTEDQCFGVLLSGHAVGSKEITDLSYASGECTSGGGKPKGSAEKDATRMVTFCCAQPKNEAK